MSGEIPLESDVNGGLCNGDVTINHDDHRRSASTPPQVSPEMLFKISKKIAQLTKVRDV